MFPSRRGFTTMDPEPLREIRQNRVNVPRPMMSSTLTISPPKKTQAEAEPPTPTMELRVFQPKERLDFGKVELGKSKTLHLLLVNPAAGPQEIEFEKPPSAEEGFSSDNIFGSILPGETKRVVFTWEPRKEGSVYESVRLLTTDGHRIHVSLVGNCFKKPVKTVRRGPNRKGTLGQGSRPASNAGHPIHRVQTYTVTKSQRPDGDALPDSTFVFPNRMKPHEAVVKIQATWRGYIARKKLLGILYSQEQERREELHRKAAIVIQSAWRAFLSRREFRVLRQRRQEEERNRVRAIVVVQSVWRGILARRRLAQLHLQRQQQRNQAATVIQSTWRALLARRMLRAMQLQRQLQCTRAAIVIQTQWRAFVARRILHELRRRRDEQHHAACVIQSSWRCCLARRLLLQLKQEAAARARELEQRRQQAATVIQAAWRAYKRRQLKTLRDREVRSATVIQASWRGFCVRKELKRQHHAAVKIQSVWRCFAARKLLRHLRVKAVEAKRQQQLEEAAALVIQSAWRVFQKRQQVKRQQQRQIEARVRAATLIQATWRGYRTRKEIFKRDKAIQAANRRVSECQRKAVPGQTLAARTSSGLEALLRYRRMQQLNDHLLSLETSTRLSSECCRSISSPAALDALLRKLVESNRSEPSKKLTEVILDIFINIAKFEETRPALLATRHLLDGLLQRAKAFACIDAIVTRFLTLLWILITKEGAVLKVSAAGFACLLFQY